MPPRVSYSIQLRPRSSSVARPRGSARSPALSKHGWRVVTPSALDVTSGARGKLRVTHRAERATPANAESLVTALGRHSAVIALHKVSDGRSSCTFEGRRNLKTRSQCCNRDEPVDGLHAGRAPVSIALAAKTLRTRAA